MSDLFRSTFNSAFVARFFAVECKARPVLTYLRKSILANRWVENLLQVTQVRREWRIDVILWSLYFIAEIVNME